MLPDKNTKPQGGAGRPLGPQVKCSLGCRAGEGAGAGSAHPVTWRLAVDRGLPSLGFSFLVYKMTELEQTIPMVLQSPAL